MPKAATRKPAARKGATRKRTTTRTKKAGKTSTSTRGAGQARKRATAARVGRKKTAARAAASRRRAKTTTRPSAVRSAAVTVKGRLAGAVAAVKQKSPWAGQPDAITFLETDHRRLEDLLAQGQETTPRATKARTRLLDTLAAELNVHELMEEELLYPALKPHPEARDIVLEGIQEHHVADVLLKELRLLARSNEQWGAKWKVLQESIEHHIKEEENKMFPVGRGVLGADELLALGQRMAKMKAGAGLRKRG